MEEMKRLFKKEEKRHVLWPEQEEKIEKLKANCHLSTDTYDPSNTREVEKRIVGRLKNQKE